MRILLATALLLSLLPAAPAATPERTGATAPRLFVFAAGQAPDQTSTPTPSPTPAATPTPDPELAEAQRAAKIAEEEKKREVSEKEAAEARAARLKALVQPFGAPNNVAVPMGTVQTDAAGWAETQALAQEAARQITGYMSNRLCTDPSGVTEQKLNIKNLVIYNANDMAALELYDSIALQLTLLQDEFGVRHNEAVALLRETDPTATPTPAPLQPAGGQEDRTGGLGALETALALPGIATSLVKSVAELLSLFRTDTQFTNEALVVNEDKIVGYLGAYLSGDMKMGTGLADCSKRFYIYYPQLMAPRPETATGPAGTCPEGKNIVGMVQTLGRLRLQAALNSRDLEARIELLTKLGEAIKAKKDNATALAGKQQELAKKQEELKNPKTPRARKRKLRDEEIPAVNKEIDALKEQQPKLDKNIKTASGKGDALTDEAFKIILANAGEYEKWKKRLAELKGKVDLLVTSTEQLLTKLNTPDESTRLTALARLVRAERLNCIFNAAGTYILRVNVDANGTTKIKKNFFFDAKVRHSARASLNFLLFDKLGRVVKSSPMQCYIDYHSARQVRDAVSGNGAPVACSMQGAAGFQPQARRGRDKKQKDETGK